MREKTWPALPHDPHWVLEQIELGFREIGSPARGPAAIPRRSQEEIESAVTRALQEELARLEQEEGRKP